MLTLTTSIDEIDALIKNMEYLSPQQSERIRISKLDELKKLMENKPLLELIEDISGKDWQDDTQRVIKKIENKYKIQQFTDIYINSLRCLLIYKAITDVTSSCTLELTKEFGQWIFNARYRGENHVVKWFDIKVNRYFSKTDLPKKFMDLMAGNQTYPITKEWVLKNQGIFFNQSIFNDYNVLLAEFLEKLKKEEVTPELEIADNLPQEDDVVNNVPTEQVPSIKTSESSLLINTSVSTISKGNLENSAIAKVNNEFKKKMIQIGVDIAGDPIMAEESTLETAKVEEKVKMEFVELEKTIVANDIKTSIEIIEKVSVVQLENLSNELGQEPLPWEDDLRTTIPKTESIIEKIELPKAENFPEKIDISTKVEIKPVAEISTKTFNKPGSSNTYAKPGSNQVYSKPGSGFNKPGQKPGSSIIVGNYDDDGYDDIKEEPENFKDDLFDNDIEPISKYSENNVNDNIIESNSLEGVIADVNIAVDFEELVEEKNKLNALLAEEETPEQVIITERLFQNGMTNKTEKEIELQKQKEEEIKKLEESIKIREQEDKEKMERSGLSKNRAFMSLKKKVEPEVETKSE